MAFRRRASLEDLEEKRDRVVVEEEIVTKEAEIAERAAVISELKKRYGRSWAKTLGISKFTDLSTLRSFLVSAKKGLESQSSSGSSMPIGKAFNFESIRKA